MDQSLTGEDFWNQFPQMQSISAPGTPYGTQAGSQDTGIAGPTMSQPAQTSYPINGMPVDTGYSTGAASGAPKTGMSGGGADAFGQAWLASGGKTVTDLKNFVAAHPEYGVKLGGSKGDKVYGPDGTFWADAVESAGMNGGVRGLWSTGTGGGGGGNNLASLGYGFGSSMAPWTQDYNPLTADQALKTPGLMFAAQQAYRMGENGAAAKGTLLNGRFQEALNASTIGNLLQGYDTAEGRNMNQYMLRRDNFFQNEDRPFDKNLSLAKL